jgi:hypothetical protein
VRFLPISKARVYLLLFLLPLADVLVHLNPIVSNQQSYPIANLSIHNSIIQSEPSSSSVERTVTPTITRCTVHVSLRKADLHPTTPTTALDALRGDEGQPMTRWRIRSFMEETFLKAASQSNCADSEDICKYVRCSYTHSGNKTVCKTDGSHRVGIWEPGRHQCPSTSDLSRLFV